MASLQQLDSESQPLCLMPGPVLLGHSCLQVALRTFLTIETLLPIAPSLWVFFFLISRGEVLCQWDRNTGLSPTSVPRQCRAGRPRHPSPQQPYVSSCLLSHKLGTLTVCWCYSWSVGLKDIALTHDKWASHLVLCCPVVHGGWGARRGVDSPLGEWNLLNTACLALPAGKPLPCCACALWS